MTRAVGGNVAMALACSAATAVHARQGDWLGLALGVALTAFWGAMASAQINRP